jgi:Uri superfamily endonuclease
MNSDPGTYALIMQSPQPLSVCVGKVGNVGLIRGYYIYAGSARGPGGLKARVARHLKKIKRCHWHIDYLTTNIPVIEVWYSYSNSSDECLWAAGLRANNKQFTEVPGLGASDCRCRSHLFFTTERPRLQDFDARVNSSIEPVLSSLTESHQTQH